MTNTLPDALVAYLEQRDAQRAADIRSKLDALTDRERALTKEAAVMGYVQGRRHLDGEDHPKDSHVLALVIDACTAFPDLYPAVSMLGTNSHVMDDDPREDLLKQRAWLIASTHLTEDVLRQRAEAFQLYPEHMDIWRTVEGIDYLLRDEEGGQ